MLVFVSDFHFSDSSAGTQTVPVEAYEETFRDIASYANEASARQVEIILLGDIFDLIRTTGWFEVPMEDRPWGVGPDEDQDPAHLAKVEAHANVLFDRLVDINRKPLQLLSTDLSQLGFKQPVSRVYIPGNHDRLCNQFPSLRRKVLQHLGYEHNPAAPSDAFLGQKHDPSVPFSNVYWNAPYLTLARHGHEWDSWNSEVGWTIRSKSRLLEPSWETYMKVPLGDAIACEFISRLADRVNEALSTELPSDESRRIANQLKSIDDVRPLSGVVAYLFDQLADYKRQRLPRDTQRRIRQAVLDVLHHLGDVPLVKAKMGQTHWGGLGKPPWVVRVIRELARLVGVEIMLRLGGFVDTIAPGDNFASSALAELKRLDLPTAEPLYILYGHTHAPDQIPLALSKDHRPQVYLNTGTWRPVHRQALKGEGFISTKGMTYSMVYHPELDPGPLTGRNKRSYPTFETWTGALLDPPAVSTEQP